MPFFISEFKSFFILFFARTRKSSHTYSAKYMTCWVYIERKNRYIHTLKHFGRWKFIWIFFYFKLEKIKKMMMMMISI